MRPRAPQHPRVVPTEYRRLPIHGLPRDRLWFREVGAHRQAVHAPPHPRLHKHVGGHVAARLHLHFRSSHALFGDLDAVHLPKMALLRAW